MTDVRSKNEAAEKLRDDIKLYIDPIDSDEWTDTLDAALARERRRTVERIRDYASHDADCAHFRIELADCDCGLSAILTESEAER